MSTFSSPKLSILLTTAGALPFVVAVALLLAGITELPLLGSVHHLLSSYTLLIASFLCGVHWGQAQSVEQASVPTLLLLSNLLALTLWFAYLLLPVAGFLLAALVVFSILLVIDALLHRAGLIATAYFRLRCWITLFVMLAVAAGSVL